MTCTTIRTTQKNPKFCVYKPRNVFIHTPKQAGTAGQGEKQQKNQEFWPIEVSLGEKCDFLGGFGWGEGGERGFGDMGTAQGQTHPSPSRSQGIGWEFGVFHQISQFFHLCCSLIIHASAAPIQQLIRVWEPPKIDFIFSLCCRWIPLFFWIFF